MKKIIGILILAAVIGSLFYATVKVSSLKEALQMWGVGLIGATAIILAGYLIVAD